MKFIKKTISLSLLLSLGTAFPCVHNIDPNSVQTIGYSEKHEDQKNTYFRYEVIAGKSMPQKKMVKLFFVNESTSKDITFLNIEKHPEIKKEFEEIKLTAAYLPSRGTRGGSNVEIKETIIGNKKISAPLIIDQNYAYFSDEDVSISTIYSHISDKYGIEKGASQHTQEMNSKLQNAVKAGLKVLVVSIEQTSDEVESVGIAMKIKDSYTDFSSYTSDVLKIKGMELDMSSVGNWAFKIGGSSIKKYQITQVVSEATDVKTIQEYGLKNYVNFINHYTQVTHFDTIPPADQDWTKVQIVQVPFSVPVSGYDYQYDVDDTEILIARIVNQ